MAKTAYLDILPLVQTRVVPTQSRVLSDGTRFLDFSLAAFGTLCGTCLPADHDRLLVVHLGEKLSGAGRVDRDPPGSIRYRRIIHAIAPGETAWQLEIPPDERNTGPGAVKMPETIGEVLPFRYAEIEEAEPWGLEEITQLAAHYPFDEGAASFACSEGVLNAVWSLCKYSVKATSFCGLYVDGDRERIPYEGDAYINQLCHYGVDRQYGMARATLEYLLQFPTWPTEWQMYTVIMALEEIRYTGDLSLAERHYDLLCKKTLIDLAREDGLISTESDRCNEEFERSIGLWHDRYIFEHGLRDVVDWPPGSFTDGGQGERDNHEMCAINTVVNALHVAACQCMAEVAMLLGRTGDAERFSSQAGRATRALNGALFDHERGVYVDGEGSAHSSLHSNMFPLAFGLVPDQHVPGVIDFVKSRGMACSVYGAQFLLDALYRHGEADYALELMAATHDRSWWNMLQAGSTVTLEAWDLTYKLNLDWNHAWGAAPANLLPRRLMGVRPKAPGCRELIIQPQPGSLRWARADIPIPQGTVNLNLERDGERWNVWGELPEGVSAILELGGEKKPLTSGPFSLVC